MVSKPVKEFDKSGDYIAIIDREKGIVAVIYAREEAGEQVANIDDHDGWVEFARSLAMLQMLEDS